MCTPSVALHSARKLSIAACITTMLFGALPAAAAEMFAVTTLVSDNGAGLQDASLVNPWGVATSATSPFWVSNNGTGTSTLYNVNSATDATSKVGLTVTIPGAGSVTGQVFNGDVDAFNGDAFLFVSEDGTVSGWRGALGTSAETLVLPSSAIYKGAAIGGTQSGTYLYAANFASGAVDVFKGSAGAPDLAGNFTDPNLPSGYGAFNVQRIGNRLFVAYAEKDPNSVDEVAGPGLGIVDAFDFDGNFVARIATGGALNAPWGLALAPSSWGTLAGTLLVGNFGDGTINAYDLTTRAFVAQLLDGAGQPLAIDGLWALAPGNNGSAGSADRIYFTAGPNDEANGAFGVISAVPLPAAWPLLVTGFIGLVPCIRRRRPS